MTASRPSNEFCDVNRLYAERRRELFVAACWNRIRALAQPATRSEVPQLARRQ